MSKYKTSSAMTKRFKFTANGGFLRHRAGRNHLLHKKSSNRKKRLSHTVLVKKQDAKAIRSNLLI